MAFRREKEETETGMMYLYLSESQSLSLHLSFTQSRTCSSCHTSSLTFSVSHFMTFIHCKFFLFLSCWFTICAALPLCISFCPCPRSFAAALLLTWHRDVVSPGREEERTKADTKSLFFLILPASNNLSGPLTFSLLFETERNGVCIKVNNGPAGHLLKAEKKH